MLGWMLKRGEHAPDADAGDPTRLEEPDTPAPVFAARAFKSALFGTPAPRAAGTPSRPERNPGHSTTATSAAAKAGKGVGTLSKPPGILLTPGTGTTRRKRVSFDYDPAGTSKPSLGGETRTKQISDGHGRLRNANPPINSRWEAKNASTGPPVAESDSEGEWKEDHGEDFCTHDVTVDLNEPHSESGRYWKEQFEKYHQEAKAEMEKLLKYKQLAKSYARQKDAEAIQLAERLRDEQQKVIKMEKKIAENASQIVSRQRHSSDNEPTELLSKLSRQTASAAQYRCRVQELEKELDELVRTKEGASTGMGRYRRQTAASPTTQKTLVETQRELRRARIQLRELDSLRGEFSALKAAAKNETDGEASAVGSRARVLKTQLDQLKDESNKKTEELRQLKSAFAAYRKESEAYEADTKAVLERAHIKISDLKKEVKVLKLSSSTHHRTDKQRLSSEQNQEPDCGIDVAYRIPRHRHVGREEKSIYDDVLVSHDTERPGLQRLTKMRDQAGDDSAVVPTAASGALMERTNHAKSKWQPFVPRSPRNKGLAGSDATPRHTISAPTVKPGDTMAPNDVAEVKAEARRTGALPGTLDSDGEGGGDIDLLHGRFARLGGPPHADAIGLVSSTPVLTAPKGRALPPERRAAALARIEKRMADKKRARKRAAGDKENERP